MAAVLTVMDLTTEDTEMTSVYSRVAVIRAFNFMFSVSSVVKTVFQPL